MDLRERIAEQEHEQWMQWAKSLMSSEAHISGARLMRWKDCMVPYADLSEDMKDHDRVWADAILALPEISQLRERAEKAERELDAERRAHDETKADLAECYNDLTAMTQKWMDEAKAVEWAAGNMIMRLHGSDDGAWEMLTPKEIRERAKC